MEEQGYVCKLYVYWNFRFLEGLVFGRGYFRGGGREECINIRKRLFDGRGGVVWEVSLWLFGVWWR